MQIESDICIDISTTMSTSEDDFDPLGDARTRVKNKLGFWRQKMLVSDGCQTRLTTNYQMLEHRLCEVDGIEDKLELLKRFSELEKILDLKNFKLLDGLEQEVNKRMGVSIGAIQCSEDP